MDYRGLTIGDWLLDKEEGFARRVVQVTDAAFDGCGAGVILENGMDYQECEPIPLTAEILEKNGFIRQQFGHFRYENEDNDLVMAFYPKEKNYAEGGYDYIDIYKGRMTLREMPISYVHQLQHALRLCGIDKEIVL